jgi:hypothetical protein
LQVNYGYHLRRTIARSSQSRISQPAGSLTIRHSYPRSHSLVLWANESAAIPASINAADTNATNSMGKMTTPTPSSMRRTPGTNTNESLISLFMDSPPTRSLCWPSVPALCAAQARLSCFSVRAKTGCNAALISSLSRSFSASAPQFWAESQ